MKKHFLIILTLVLFSTNSIYSQQHPGFKAGYNFVSINTDQIDISGSSGISAGIATTWIANDNLDFLIDFSFEQLGTKVMAREASSYTNPIGSSYKEYELTGNGVYGTVMANYHILFPYLSVNSGFVYGFSWSKDEYYGQEIYAGYGETAQDNIQLTELSYLLSGGDAFVAFGLSSGTEALRFHARYHLGLKNYFKNDLYTYPDEYKMKKNFFQLSISYTFLNVQIL